MKYLGLTGFCLLLLSCAVNNNEIDGPLFCTIDQTEVYQLGLDPAADFNVTNLVKNITFNANTDCPNVNNDAFSDFVSRAKRVGSQLQIFEDQYQANQFLLEMNISGTNLEPVKNVVNINNCSIVRIWQGVLDTPGNTITINEVVSYKGACQSTFYDPEFDTTNPGS